MCVGDVENWNELRLKQRWRPSNSWEKGEGEEEDI
jgi:hypothetical protein